LTHRNGKAESRIGSESPRIPNTTPQATASGYQVAIRRTGQAVEITLTSNNEYASIELYDSLVQSVRKGFLRLELKISHS
jgi:hypothetical protein